MSGFELYLEREDGETTFVGTGTGLKLCPFCGGEASMRSLCGLYWVGCDSCKGNNSETRPCCASCARAFDTLVKAAEAWNMRHERTSRDFGGEEGTVGEGYDFACGLCGFCCDLPDARYCPSCGARVEEAVG